MIRFAVVGLLILSGIFPAAAKKKPTPKTNRPNKSQTEAATRLQIFLDRANFGPGKIDGHYGDFTLKALALYRESRGEQPQTPPSQPKAKGNLTPDVNGLDLASVEPMPVLPGEQFDTYRYKLGVIGGYHPVGQFLSNVGSLNRIIAPVTMAIKLHPVANNTKARLKKGESLVDTEFQVQTYVARTTPYAPPSAVK